jgi:1-acyl-sn-glycerol-3-phosphate acyltransferase
MSAFSKDSRDERYFKRYHKAAQRRVPWAQTVLLLVVVPILTLITRLRVKGRENIPNGGYIVAANHPSQLDPLFVGLAIRRRIRFMGKSELFNERNGRWLSMLGSFPVRRGVWDADAFVTAETVLRRKRVMAMFPEGGVSHIGSYRDTRPGIGYVANRAGATVLPVHLSGTRKLYNPMSWPKIRIVIGKPIYVPQNLEPTPDENQVVAEQIFDSIKALG